MLNQVVLVGRVNDIQKTYIDLKVPRSYKNEKGEYENDFVTCYFSNDNNASEQANEYLKKNNIVGIKGCLESDGDELYVRIQKLTYLTSLNTEE